MSGEKLATVEIDEDLDERILEAASHLSSTKVPSWAGQTPHVREMALLAHECWWVEYQRVNVSVSGAPPRVCNIIRFTSIRPRHVPTEGPSVAEVLRRLNDFAEANEAQRVLEDYEWFIICCMTPTNLRYLIEPEAMQPYLASTSEHMRDWAENALAELSVPSGPLWDRLEPMFAAAVAGLDWEDARCPLEDWLKNDHPWLGYGAWKEMYRYAAGAAQKAWVENLRRIDFTATFVADLREADSWEKIAEVMGSAAVINDEGEGRKDVAWNPWVQEFIASVVSVLTPDELPHLLSYRGRGAADLRFWTIAFLDNMGSKQSPTPTPS
ncbi:MAG: hypothetical protein NTX29_09200 [Actinobacteria bacterium]|nr:hypothetical protein [Actinomycetota bacterium]